MHSQFDLRGPHFSMGSSPKNLHRNFDPEMVLLYLAALQFFPTRFSSLALQIWLYGTTIKSFLSVHNLAGKQKVITKMANLSTKFLTRNLAFRKGQIQPRLFVSKLGRTKTPLEVGPSLAPFSSTIMALALSCIRQVKILQTTLTWICMDS